VPKKRTKTPTTLVTNEQLLPINDRADPTLTDFEVLLNTKGAPKKEGANKKRKNMSKADETYHKPLENILNNAIVIQQSWS
jgi:hypothetical protein